MFNPKDYTKATPIDPWKEKYRTVIKDTLLVLNYHKNTTNLIKDFKSGVKFSATINGASYSADYASTEEAMNYIRNGHHKRWSKTRSYQDPTDKRIRVYLIERGKPEDKWSHYLTVRDNKVVLVTL